MFRTLVFEKCGVKNCLLGDVTRMHEECKTQLQMSAQLSNYLHQFPHLFCPIKCFKSHGQNSKYIIKYVLLLWHE